ncbi:protocadherin beta-15-like, partial [Geospiza fortis]|uniref:Protocadherin beta-15-like n=1 Tax=Geospiza fortis TaxID=48883 RepID=A0A6I9ZE61_GEOFO
FRVEVTLVDINDHSPVFPNDRVTFKILETSEPGSRFPLEVARDLDIGRNTVQDYSISPETEYFTVSYGTGITGKKSLELVLEKPLDREKQAEMGFSVIAVDGGSPPRSGTTEINVVILDVNDNAPKFTQEEYIGKILENMPEGSVVLTVLANDPDAGVNGDITYQLSQAVGQSVSAFVIDHVTGEIKLTKPLDFEAAQMHELSVRATDGGGLSAICKVLVELVDVNDNAPELVVSSFSSPLPENTVVAVDADSGQNSWLSYHLLRATDPGLFSVGLQSGEVRLRRPVTERDSVKQKLLVLVRDNGKPPLSATAALSALLLKDFSDVRLPHSSPASEDQAASLTTYLIIALVFVSLLFLISTAVLVARKVCRRKELKAGHVLYAADTLQSGPADAAAAGTLPRAYCYEISLTTGSGNSEFRFLKPILPSLPPQHCAVGQGPEEEQDFPGVPVSTEDMAPDNAGALSAGQFNALSFS